MRLKAEWEPQERVYLCFGSDKRPVYGKERLARIREDLGVLARAIRPFAPVTMLINPGDETRAADMCGDGIDLLVMRHFDIWARDTLGLPLRSDNGALSWLDMNFNVWGEVSRNSGYAADRELARLFAQTHLGCPVHTAGFILEGGALESDGNGTLLTTESCVLHDKRNGALDRQSAEVMLRRETGAKSVVWLPGYKGKDDITSGHIDGLARFVAAGRIIVEADSSGESDLSAENLAVLAGARTADGRELDVIKLTPPPESVPKREVYYASTYLNFLIVNGGVIVPAFAAEAEATDRRAQETFAFLFPDKTITPLCLEHVFQEGGGIHCVTMNV